MSGSNWLDKWLPDFGTKQVVIMMVDAIKIRAFFQCQAKGNQTPFKSLLKVQSSNPARVDSVDTEALDLGQQQRGSVVAHELYAWRFFSSVLSCH